MSDRIQNIEDLAASTGLAIERPEHQPGSISGTPNIRVITKLNYCAVIDIRLCALICQMLLCCSVSFAGESGTSYKPPRPDPISQATPAIDSLVKFLGYESYGEMYAVCKREALFDVFGNYELSSGRADFRKTVDYCRLFILADSADTSIPICIFLRKADGIILGYLIGRTDEPAYANWASADDVTFHIELSRGDINDEVIRSEEVDSLVVRCVWENVGMEAVILFLERSENTAGYFHQAQGMTARVVNDECKIFTNHELIQNRDWSKYPFPNASSYNESLYDTVMIHPAEQVIRDVSLMEMLWRFPDFINGIPPGRYRVQLSLETLVSNELIIEIVE